MEKFKEIWATIDKESKEKLYNLVGKTFTNGKRQAIPKDIYDNMTKEQRIAARYILDLAQECFGNTSDKWL